MLSFSLTYPYYYATKLVPNAFVSSMFIVCHVMSHIQIDELDT